MNLADEVPDLENMVCESLIRCDEYSGEKYIGNSGILLKISNAKWHWVFFDYFPLFWHQEDEVPPFEITASLHMRSFEIGEELNINGRIINKVDFVKIESIREVHFQFDNGVEIKLVHNSKTWEKQFFYQRQSKSEEWMQG